MTEKNIDSNTTKRQADFEIDSLFLNRWSPRAFSPEPIDDTVINSIFEAARWSMSCFNDQPWLIGYAVNETDRERYLSILAEGNQAWARSAPILGIIFARRRFEHNDKPNRWAEFDSGAAWMALTIQARMHGLYTHGMGGFDEEKTYEVLNVPSSDYVALCAFAMGQIGDSSILPEEIQKRERPSGRKPQAETVFQGKYNK